MCQTKVSRGTSLEAFIVCLGYKPRPGWKPTLDLTKSTEEFFEGADIGKQTTTQILEYSEEERKIAPFIACGDINDIDSDATYSLDLSTLTLDPVQNQQPHHIKGIGNEAQRRFA